MKKAIALTLALMLTIAPMAMAETKLSIQGSTSVMPLMEKLTEKFVPDGFTCEIQGTGSSAGLKAAVEGTAQLAMSSRGLKEAELVDLTPVTIAMDGIAVVVNPENAVSDLTAEQLAQVFKGEISNWSQLGGADAPIVLISREAGSGTRDAFEELMKLTAEKDGRTISLVDLAYPIIATGNGEIKQNVASKRGAIGYISLGSVDDTLKALAVGGVLPAPETVKDGSYVVARPFIVATKGQPTAEAQQLIDFILGEEGQAVVAAHHYITVGE